MLRPLRPSDHSSGRLLTHCSVSPPIHKRIPRQSIIVPTKQKQSDAASMRIAMPPIHNSAITSFVSTPTRSGSRAGFGASQTHQYQHSAQRFTTQQNSVRTAYHSHSSHLRFTDPRYSHSSHSLTSHSLVGSCPSSTPISRARGVSVSATTSRDLMLFPRCSESPSAPCARNVDLLQCTHLL